MAAAQERMGQLMGLMRSFGPTMEAVFERWDEAAALVGLVDDADENLARAEAAAEAAESALAEAAAAYDAARIEAAPRFAAAVNEVLGRLEMGTAALVCTVEPLPRESWSAAGSASVVFEFKPGASMQPRPLARIASGGEISRVMLAIKVALGAKDGTETLIFDEVDAGVGGSTANALAAVLAELAESHQVIAITHLAQVAVLADTHYTVTKTAGDAPETVLTPVEGDERVAEVARLLSGTATETSLAHARELLGSKPSATVGPRRADLGPPSRQRLCCDKGDQGRPTKIIRRVFRKMLLFRLLLGGQFLGQRLGVVVGQKLVDGHERSPPP
ncbi:MAG: hypothetical protein ACLSDQ_00175 [Adlercreutzia equolifaciens]